VPFARIRRQLERGHDELEPIQEPHSSHNPA